MLPQRSPRFKAYVAPAKAYPQIWRLLLGIGLLSAVYLVISIAIIGAARVLLAQQGISFPSTDLAGHRFVKPFGMAILLATFIGLTLGTALAARLLHKRGFLTLISPDFRMMWPQVRITAQVVIPLYAVFLVVSILFNPPRPNLDFVTWLAWMPLALPLLLVQTSAEELVFRGYLQQQLAARFSSRWVWMVLPSVVFGLLHYDAGGLKSNAWLMVVDTAIIGFIAADLTARTGSLGAAITFHFCNNFFAMFLMSIDGSMKGLALYVAPYSAADEGMLRPLLIVDIATNLLLYLIYARIMARRGL